MHPIFRSDKYWSKKIIQLFETPSYTLGQWQTPYKTYKVISPGEAEVVLVDTPSYIHWLYMAPALWAMRFSDW